MTDLPFVDEHELDVRAEPGQTWVALRAYAVGLGFKGDGVLAKALGTVPPEGFAIGHEVPGEELVLVGRHRFADYRLVFRVRPDGEGRSQVSATTYAAFPGVGRLYRVLVIGSGGHRLAVRRMLRVIARKAEETRLT